MSSASSSDVVAAAETDVAKFESALEEYSCRWVNNVLDTAGDDSSKKETPACLNDIDPCANRHLMTCDEISASLEAIQRQASVASNVLIPKVEANMRQVETLFQLINSLDLITLAMERSADQR